MRPQRHRIDFVLLLVADPGVDYVFCEYIAAEQELMVLSKGVQRLTKRTRGLRYFGQLFRSQIVDVFVEGFARMNLVLNTIQRGHHHGGKRQVRIRTRVRTTELDPLGLWA